LAALEAANIQLMFLRGAMASAPQEAALRLS
jgi:hypothetical protein